MIAVVGASGRIGGEVLARLGGDARPISRSHGIDLNHGAQLAAALDGCTRMFLVTPHGPEQEQLEAAAVDAARHAGVEHVVKVSGGAATLGPNGTTATAVAHWRSEQRIERSGMGFTFLRPSFFMQNLPELSAAPFARTPIAMIDLRDVAACAVSVLQDPAPVEQAWQLTGPRAVAPAEAGVRHVPMWLARRGLTRKPAFERQHALRMAEYLAAGCDASVTDHVLRLTGQRARSLEDFLKEA